MGFGLKIKNKKFTTESKTKKGRYIESKPVYEN